MRRVNLEHFVKAAQAFEIESHFRIGFTGIGEVDAPFSITFDYHEVLEAVDGFLRHLNRLISEVDEP